MSPANGRTLNLADPADAFSEAHQGPLDLGVKPLCRNGVVDRVPGSTETRVELNNLTFKHLRILQETVEARLMLTHAYTFEVRVPS
jgi:hypothetical protein